MNDSFDEIIDAIEGNTIIDVDVDSGDNEIFFVLDSNHAFSVGYEKGEGLVLKLYERDELALN